MEGAASHKEEVAYELRRQAALLPEGTDRVDGTITPALWEGRAAEAADDALASSVRWIRQAAEDLEEIAAELEDEAHGLRQDAADAGRQADDLQAELDAEADAGAVA